MEWVIGTARREPIVIAIEDLHWADPSTLELLQLLAEQGATARLLLLYTARPEFHARWPLRAHHMQITLNRLSSRNVRTMVEEVVAHETSHRLLTEATIATVVERTGGVPLFVEELTRAVIESVDAKLTEREIPVTLRDSLMARLDRLGPAREVIQVGAVIGNEFSYELLHAIHPIAEEELQRALRILADTELLYVRGIAPEASYLFKHALIRDVAYEALLKSRRKDLHRLIARTIDEKFPTLKVSRPEILARHWTEADEGELAIAAWSRAGKAAEARNAFSEALESYQQALALLNSLAESPQRDLRELTLRQSVVQMLWVTRGYAAPETSDATERAAALAEKSGNLAQLVNLMILRGVSALVAGDIPAAGTLANLALDLGVREASPTSLGVAHHLQILTRYSRGDLAGVEKHFAAGEAFFLDPGLKQYPGATVSAFGFASFNALVLGRADLARARSARMMAAADQANPFDEALSGYYAAVLRVLLREYESAEALAARVLALSEEHQFQLLQLHSKCVLGQARAYLGRAPEGIELIRQGIDGLLDIGARLGLNNFTAQIAEAQAHKGAIAEALKTIEQALQTKNPNPETLRLRGELRFKQGQRELAEADFREAIALTRRVGAKFYELRATISLARLLAKQNQAAEARAMLAGIYNWFTEGLDTMDLKEAKALLDELRA